MIPEERVKNMPPTNKQPATVPLDCSGKWIAWSHDNSRIVASGDTYEDVRAAAMAANEPKAYLERVPRSRSFVGGSP